MTDLELKELIKTECVKFGAEVVIRFGFPDEPNKEITQDVIDSVSKYYDKRVFDPAKK